MLTRLCPGECKTSRNLLFVERALTSSRPPSQCEAAKGSHGCTKGSFPVQEEEVLHADLGTKTSKTQLEAPHRLTASKLTTMFGPGIPRMAYPEPLCDPKLCLLEDPPATILVATNEKLLSFHSSRPHSKCFMQSVRSYKGR